MHTCVIVCCKVFSKAIDAVKQCMFTIANARAHAYKHACTSVSSSFYAHFTCLFTLVCAHAPASRISRCCIFQVMKTDKSLASASSSSSSDKRKSASADADKKKVAIRYEKSKDVAGRLVSPITAVLFTHTRHCG